MAPAWTTSGRQTNLSPVSQLISPKILFRAMRRAEDARPLCGQLANELGVRPGIDISSDQVGRVHPETGGLSATPDDPNALPPHVRPPSLGGRGKLPIFVVEAAALQSDLAVRRDPKHPLRHAFIEPSARMALSSLQEYLCGSRTHWKEV